MTVSVKILLLAVLLMSIFFIFFSISGEAKPPASEPGIEYWTGNGDENNCDGGGTYHWILTQAGKDFEITSATIHVTYTNGSISTAEGYRPGGGSGAIHFDTTGGEVESAYATYNYIGTPGNLVLTISHSTCNVTTTTEELTTTTSEVTTTTKQPTTTTEIVTTTTEEVTTTTDGVTTTSEPSTTSTSSTTTTTTPKETTTTTVQTTTTTINTESTTTTTELGTTTTEAVTTTTESTSGGGVTTTTVQQATTATEQGYRTTYPFTGTNSTRLLFAIIGGIFLIGTGIYFLVSERG